MKAQPSMPYQLRLHRVINYIYQNLSKDLALEQRDRQETGNNIASYYPLRQR